MKWSKEEIFGKAVKKMCRPCSTGVMIDRRVLLLLLRLRGKNKKGLDKSEKK